MRLNVFVFNRAKWACVVAYCNMMYGEDERHPPRSRTETCQFLWKPRGSSTVNRMDIIQISSIKSNGITCNCRRSS